MVDAQPVATASAFDPTQLLPDAEEPEIAFASALGNASRGAFALARAELSSIADGGGSEWASRATQEIARVDEFVRVRRRFLEHLRDKGQKLNLMMGDRRLLAPIESIEEDVLLLGKSKLGLDRLALDEIDAVQLADLMRTNKYKFDPGWAAGYAYLLNGDARWKKSLDSDDALAGAIRNDAEADYPVWLAASTAIRELRRLAALGVPEDAGEARRAFEAIQRLHQSDATLLEQHRGALRRYARAVLESVFKEGGLTDALHGSVITLSGGRVRITYPLRDEKELNDFTDCAAVGSSPSQFSGLTLGYGKLSATGNACLRHKLSFEGEQVFRFTYRYRFPGGSTRGTLSLQVGFNADENDNCVSYNRRGIEVIDPGFQSSAVVKVPDDPKRSVSVELRFDGERTVDVRINGRQAAQLDCGPRVKGDFFVYASGTLILEISELSIEGTVSHEALDVLRDEWVDEQLEAASLR